MCPPGLPGPSRPAASTSGSACPTIWTPGPCWPRRSPRVWPTFPAAPSTPTAKASPASACPTASHPPTGSARASAASPESSTRSSPSPAPSAASPPETLSPTRAAPPAGAECNEPHRGSGPLRQLGWSSVTFDCSVAVIAGGLSFEREVSLRSGYRVGELDADHRLVETLNTGEFDVAFLALHGRFGEDGTVASILELLGIPYTGSSFDASRLAFDKLAAKSVLRRAGLSVPSAIPLTEGALRELGVGTLLDRAMEELGLPLVVKPNRGGSALGIRLVERPDQLPAALMAAFGYDDTVLLEERVVGTE